MARLSFRVSALAAFTLLGVIASACGGGDDSNGDGDSAGSGSTSGSGSGATVIMGTGGQTIVMNSGGSGAGVGTGGGVATGGSGAVSSVCDGLSKVGGTERLIDDFEHTDSASIAEVDNRVGSWFVANDGTPGADQTPAGDALPTAGVGHTGAGFASTAVGYETWGVLFGVSLNDNAGTGCAYDVSSYTGISFWGKANGASQDIRVAVPIPAIIPSSRGGTCQGEGCDDAHVATVTFTTEWQLFEIPWADFKQNTTWAHQNKYDFDSANIAQITFGVTQIPGSYDVVIDDLMFTGEGTPIGQGGDTAAP